MWSKITAMEYAPLPLTVTHHQLEPATSLISRLAARNGIWSVQGFCRDLRFPYAALVAGDIEAMRLLSQLGGCDADALAHSSIYNSGGNAFRLRDEVATTQSLHRSRIRVCPKCIRVDVDATHETWQAWRRVHWQFTSIRSCLTHHCELMLLPAEKLTLRGYDFSTQIRLHWPSIKQSSPGARTHTQFEKWLEARIDGKREASWFDQLELNVASRTCEILGLRLVEGPNAHLSGHSSSEWAKYADVGYRVLRDGVESFERALSEMMNDKGVDRRFFSKVYGVLTIWLNGRGLGYEFEPLKAIVRDHIFRNFSVRRGVLVLGRPSAGKSGNTQVIRTEKLPNWLTALMVQRGLAKQVVGRGSKVVVRDFVTKTMINSLKRETSTQRKRKTQFNRLHGTDCIELFDHQGSNFAMTVSEVVARLKITSPTVHYLFRNGFLLPAANPDDRRVGSVSICGYSVARFENTYLSLGRFAARHEYRTGTLAIRLKNAGIEMLAMPPKYSRIFWQKDLKRLER